MRTRGPARRRNWCFVGLLMVAVMRVPAPAQERPALVPALVIEEILPDSAAVKAGFKVGDGILSYDAKPLSSPAALQAAEENTFNKDTVVVRVQRGDDTLTLTAPLGKLGIHVRPALPQAALTLYEEGRASLKAPTTEGVIVAWTTAARAAQDAGAIASAAWLYGRLGEVREGQRQWKDASEAYAAAWTLVKQSSDAAAQARTLLALGRCSQNVSDFPAAQRWYDQAEQVDAAAGNDLWAAGDASNQGGVAYTRGDLPGAQSYHSRALTIRERLAPGSLEVAASLNGLGNVATSRGDLAVAHDYFTRAVAIQERLAPNSLAIAAVLGNVAIVAFERGDLTVAQDYHSRALAIRERLAPNSLEVAASFNNLGMVAWARGDLAAAHSYHSRSLAIKEKLAPNSMSMAASFTNLGNVASDRRDLAAAQDYQSRALSIREKLAPDSLDVATNLNNLGNVVKDRGDLLGAQDYHGRALAIRERLSPNSLNVAASLNNLGDIARSRGDLATAQDHFSRALAIKELRAPNSLNVAISLTSLGVVAGRRGDMAAEHDFHSRALTIRERLAPDSLAVADSLDNLGGIALKERRFSDALPLLTRAVDIVEAQRWQVGSADTRALLLAKYAESYSRLLRTYLALDDPPAAFATAERARARTLLEILTEARDEIRQGVDPMLLERERLLQQQLNARANRQTQVLSRQHTDEEAAAAKKELDALLIQYQEVRAEVRVRSPRYAALTQPQPLGLREIQQQVLDTGTVLLEYAMGEEASYVFAVTPTSVSSFELPKRAEIELASRRVYELLMARQPVPGEPVRQRQVRIATADAAYPAAAAALSRMVLGPVAGQLSTKRLLIVADGALQYVPFSALPEPAIGAPAAIQDKPLEDGPPLIVNHEIVSLPSASVAAVLRREFGGRQPAERLVAVLADPVFDATDSRLKRAREAPAAPPTTASLPADVERSVRSAGLVTERGSLARLPFTRDEADAILALAPAAQSTRAMDFKASRATVTGTEMSRYRIVHLATHGVLNTEHPELSGIVLSLVDEEGQVQDGFLRLHEVYNLNWPAELVVLSACQTGLGKEINGEGLVGLTRGFMYAGAERVMASLWNVNDSVTAEFMKRFYQGLFTRGLTPAAALRAAQVEMLNRQAWRSPYYWAAFVLQGEWR